MTTASAMEHTMPNETVKVALLEWTSTTLHPVKVRLKIDHRASHN